MPALQACFLYGKKIPGKNVTLEPWCPWPHVSLNYRGVNYDRSMKGRILTEVLHCNSSSGCSSEGTTSKRFNKCKVTVCIVHFRDKVQVFVDNDHGPDFKPGCGTRHGLSLEVSRL